MLLFHLNVLDCKVVTSLFLLILGALNDFDKPPPGASEGATAPVAAAAADGDNAGAGSQVYSAVEIINSSGYFYLVLHSSHLPRNQHFWHTMVSSRMKSQ